MRITQRQHKALEGSVRKWRKIVKGTGEDDGVGNCPLCKLYYDFSIQITSECKGCPIRNDTGIPGCNGTPYGDYTIAEYESIEAAVPFAQAMLSYLEDLLARCTVRKGK